MTTHFSLDLGLLIVIFSELKSWDSSKKNLFLTFENKKHPSKCWQFSSLLRTLKSQHQRERPHPVHGIEKILEKTSMRRSFGQCHFETGNPLWKKSCLAISFVTFFGMVTLNLFERLLGNKRWVTLYHLVIKSMVFFFNLRCSTLKGRWSKHSGPCASTCFSRFVAPITSYYK